MKNHGAFMWQRKVISLCFAVSYTAADVGVFKPGCCFRAEGQNANFSNLLEPNFFVYFGS